MFNAKQAVFDQFFAAGFSFQLRFLIATDGSK